MTEETFFAPKTVIFDDKIWKMADQDSTFAKFVMDSLVRHANHDFGDIPATVRGPESHVASIDGEFLGTISGYYIYKRGAGIIISTNFYEQITRVTFA